MCQKGKFKDKGIRSFVWARGAEGDQNRQFPGVYVKNSNCANDDWGRDEGSGTAICCRDKVINIGCKEKDAKGKATGFLQVRHPGGAIIGCRGYQSSSAVDPLKSQRDCYDKNQRWGSSAETNLAYVPTWTPLRVKITIGEISPVVSAQLRVHVEPVTGHGVD